MSGGEGTATAASASDRDGALLVVSSDVLSTADPGWQHGVAQDDNKNKVKCNYCAKVVSGGIYRLKQHLARIPGQVTYCTQAPQHVFLSIRDHLHNSKANRRRRQLQHDNGDDDLIHDDLEAFRNRRRPTRDGDCRTMLPSAPTLRALGFADPGWEHGVAIGDTKSKVKCNYCQKVVSGGINRFKQHLARIPGEVAPCLLAPNEVYLSIKETMKWHRNSRNQRMETKQLADLYSGSENQEVQDANGRRNKRKHLLRNEDVSCSKPAKINSRSKHRVTDSAETHIDGRQMNLSPLFAIANKQKRSLLAYNKQLKQQGVPCKKKGNKDVSSAICKFFCFAGIPFELADSSYFRKMLDLVKAHGPGLKGSASKSLTGRYLEDEVKATTKYQSEIMASWGSTGCTIIADGWKNLEGKSMINFLVSCPRGSYFISSVDTSHIVNDITGLFKLLDEVVDAIGEDNVVQVITEKSECYEAAGKMLEEKRRSLFWTPSATDCINQILVDFMEIEVVKECIEKGQIITRYIYNCSWLSNLTMNEFTEGKDLNMFSMSKAATSFLMLKSLVDCRSSLKKFFQSDRWCLSEMSKSSACQAVKRIVLDTAFWKKMLHVKTYAEPILQILKKLESSGDLSMPFLYNDMYQAKLSVRTIHHDEETLYAPFLEVIDKHWDPLFNRPLYVAAYFLNPVCRYQPDFNALAEVIRGLNECISRLESDNGKRVSATAQISEFVFAKADFGTELALSTRMDLHPAAWWQQHGISCMELQRIAIRILSQSCTTLSCEHYWSTFDLVHCTRHRHLFQKRQVVDHASVHHNLRLQERQSKKTGDSSSRPLNILMLDNVLEGWLVEPEVVQVQQHEEVIEPFDQNANGDLDTTLGSSHENITTLLELVDSAEVNPSSGLSDKSDKDGADNTDFDDDPRD